MRLFCYRPGAIGDTILTAPALAWLRGRFPGARLTLAARSDLHEIFQASGLVDEALSPDDRRFARYFDAGAADLAFSEHFGFAPDRAYVWMNRAEDFAANLKRAGVTQVAVAPARPAGVGVPTAAALFCTFAGDASDAEAPTNPANPAAAQPPGPDFFRQAFLSAPPRAMQAASAWLRERELNRPAPLLVLHAGAGGAQKLLPAAVSASLARAWTRAGGEFCLTCGPADEAAYAELTRALASDRPLEDVERRTARLSLADAAGLFTQASAVLGADSGPLHLAAALGAPSLLFYLATDPGVWRPIGPRAGIVDCRELRGATKNEAELEARALAALRALL